jgi:hypothetical protein
MVGSILAASFTGCLSLLATNIITNRVDRKKSVEIIDEVQTLAACRDTAIRQLKIHTDQFQSLIN